MKKGVFAFLGEELCSLPLPLDVGLQHRLFSLQHRLTLLTTKGLHIFDFSYYWALQLFSEQMAILDSSASDSKGSLGASSSLIL